MAELPNAEGPKKKATGADLIIPVASIAFTIYYISTIWDAPWTAKVSTFFIGGVLFLLCCIYFVMFALNYKSGEADFSFNKILNPVWAIPRRIALLAITICYIVVIEWVGFILTTYVFLVAGMFLLAEGKKTTLMIVMSVLLAVGSYFLPHVIKPELVSYLMFAVIIVIAAALFFYDSGKKKLILTLSTTLVIGGYLLFVVAFQRRFPNGPIEKWLKPFWYSTGIWQ